MNTKTQISGGSEVKHLDPAALRVVPGYSSRIKGEDYYAMRQMIVDSMRTYGYVGSPIIAYSKSVNGQEQYFILDGEMRADAANIAISEHAPFDTVPVEVHSCYSVEAERHLLSRHLNMSRSGF